MVRRWEKVLVIPLAALVDRCSADAVRYYFLKGEFSKDGDFNRNQVVMFLMQIWQMT